MPSFDIVSEVDWQEIKNAIHQANREISTRYDFKGSDAQVSECNPRLTIHADDEYKVGQVLDLLQMKLAKRSVDISCLERGAVKVSPAGTAVQEITVRQGVDTELAKKIVKLIKQRKMKVQPTIQSQQVRVSGKKRDDLQQVLAFLGEQKLGLPLQYVNFRD